MRKLIAHKILALLLAFIVGIGIFTAVPKKVFVDKFQNIQSIFSPQITLLDDLKTIILEQGENIDELRRQHKHLLLLKEEREFKKNRLSLKDERSSQTALDFLSPVGKEIIEDYKKACATHEGGELDVMPEAVWSSLVGKYDAGTITGAEFINTNHLMCPTFPQLICGGSAGCPIKVIISGKEVFDFGPMQGLQSLTAAHGEHLLLADLHGTACNTYGANYCYQALRWDGIEFLYVKY